MVIRREIAKLDTANLTGSVDFSDYLDSFQHFCKVRTWDLVMVDFDEPLTILWLSTRGHLLTKIVSLFSHILFWNVQLFRHLFHLLVGGIVLGRQQQLSL